MGRRVLLVVLLLLAGVGFAWWLLSPSSGPPPGGAGSRGEGGPSNAAGPELEAPRLEGRASIELLTAADAPAPVGATPPSAAYEGSSLCGRVADETGRNVVGARVQVETLLTGGTFRFWAGFANTTTSQDGSFRLPVPGGRHQVRVLASPVSSASLAQEVAGDAAEVVLRVVCAPNIAGRVLDPDGVPAAAVGIHLRYAGEGERVVSDEDGRFAVRCPPLAREVSVTAGALEGQGGPPPKVFGDVRYGVSPGTMDLELRLCRPVWIDGTVTGADGTVLMSGPVFARRLGEGPRAKRVTGGINQTTGRFRVGPLRPGQWELVAQPVDRAYAVSEATPVIAPNDDVRLVCPSALSIRGVVGGDDVEGFRVAWVDESYPLLGGGWGAQSVATDGTFSIPRLRSVPHRLYVWRRGDPRVAELERVWPGPDLVSVDLTPGLSISGRHAGGRPSEGSRVMATRRGVQVDALLAADGTFAVHGLTPGPWTLDVSTKAQNVEFAHGLNEVIDAGDHNVVIGE